MSNSTFDINNPKHIHFIGIGGISMSGIAKILLSHGFTVSGSDLNNTEITQDLENNGCNIFYSQDADNIPADTDFVVYTAAVHEQNPEYVEAHRRGIPMFARAEILGLIMRHYKKAICISGTHGKTTTTGMTSEILMAAETDPTISLGGILPDLGSNVRVGSTDVMLVESCEYTNSFLSFSPTTAVILNVAEDHLDFFKNLDDIRYSFKRFAALVPDDGYIIVNSDIENYQYFNSDNNSAFITFGLNPESDYHAKNITFNNQGCGSYTLVVNNNETIDIELSVPGTHCIIDSLAAAAACHVNGLSLENIARGLNKFHGTHRRFEYKGEVNGFKVIDDYAHHPDEIDATLSAAAEIDKNELWVVFQPHTFTRTKSLLEEFATSLSKIADHVIIAKIYPAREEDIYGIHSEDLAEKISNLGQDCKCINDLDEIKDYLLSHCKKGDMVITMGAGDVFKVADAMISDNNGD